MMLMPFFQIEQKQTGFLFVFSSLTFRKQLTFFQYKKKLARKVLSLFLWKAINLSLGRC
jgi:hypothetical protein